MISYIIGKEIAKCGTSVIIVTGDGLGYEIVTNGCPLPSEEELTTAWIWHVITERGQALYGFDSLNARETARTLTRVHKIGPTLASRIIHTLGYDGFIDLVRTNNPTALAKAVKGLGKAGAEGILQYWADPVALGAGAPLLRDATDILQTLGVPVDDAELRKIASDTPGGPTEVVQAYLASLS